MSDSEDYRRALLSDPPYQRYADLHAIESLRAQGVACIDSKDKRQPGVLRCDGPENDRRLVFVIPWPADQACPLINDGLREKMILQATSMTRDAWVAIVKMIPHVGLAIELDSLYPIKRER